MPTNVVQWIILIAIVAIVYVFVTAIGIPIPYWVWYIVGICLAACFVIAAIKFMQRQG